jgi:tricorn protease
LIDTALYSLAKHYLAKYYSWEYCMRTFKSLVRQNLLLSAALIALWPGNAQVQAQPATTAGSTPPYKLRYPDVHQDFVVFTYAGDLWRASTKGGTAIRLTAHPGLELFAKISPDGNWIAFTGQYDGDEQVYVIPATGGEPRKLTHYPARGPLPPRWGYDNQVYGWTNDGKSVLFRSLMDGFDLTDSRLYTVSATGGMPTPLPMPVSGAGTLSVDGTQVLYSPLFRDFRHWKRYQGGWAQDLWLFDLATKQARNVTNTVRTERDPMWLPSGPYFVSDRSGILNVYKLDLATTTAQAITNYTQGDVGWASDGPGGSKASGQIVFERNNGLTLLDTGTNQTQELTLFVPDDGLYTRAFETDASRVLGSADIGPKGARLAVVGRGDVFVVPAQSGITRNLTASSTAHDRLARFSPDGKTIAYISDASGEEELWLVAENGRTPAKQLTKGNKTRFTSLQWSPDGKSIALSAKTGALYLVDASTGVQRLIDTGGEGAIGDVSWSADSAWLAYSLPNEVGYATLQLYARADGSKRRITDPLFDSREPVFSRDGKYLFFLSRREFAPALSQVESNFSIDNQIGIFAMALSKNTPSLVPAVEDDRADEKTEVKTPDTKTPASAKDKKATTSDKPSTPQPAKTQIDFDGLEQRVTRLPITPGNYSNLTALDDGLLYEVDGSFYLGRTPFDTRLERYSFKERKSETAVARLSGYALSADASTILVRDGNTLRTINASSDKVENVSLAGMVTRVEPRQEWRTIFDEVYRRFRDYFYVANMHGYDWEKIAARYRALLPGIAHRSDLNVLIGEMIAELNAGHAYIDGGDMRLGRRQNVGLLGARFTQDPQTNLYRFSKIFQGHNEEIKYRSPLTEVGVNIAAGDYLFAINGQSLTGTNPYELLRGKAGQAVELLVGKTANPAQARLVTINTLTSETNLLYLEWVLANRARVEKMSNGRFGYLHIPDMGEDGLYEFIKWFYPQVRKQGLVIDVRTNGGGFVSQMLIERLRRTLLGTNFQRDGAFTGTYPSVVFTGPMVALADEDTASDGDIFSYMFKESKLGPVIGKRTWGGVVGITNRGLLLDGGVTNVPEFSTNDKNGAYAIEGEGVSPDIEVEQDPGLVIAGGDPQLERALAELEKLRQSRPASTLPSRPADPVKTQ